MPRPWSLLASSRYKVRDDAYNPILVRYEAPLLVGRSSSQGTSCSAATMTDEFEPRLGGAMRFAWVAVNCTVMRMPTTETPALYVAFGSRQLGTPQSSDSPRDVPDFPKHRPACKLGQSFARDCLIAVATRYQFPN
jgi:hypothetical protein